MSAQWIVLGRVDETVDWVARDAAGATLGTGSLAASRLADWVAAQEADIAPRWVWNDTAAWYPALLSAGVRVARCHDLRLCHAILREAAETADHASRRASAWDAPAMAEAASPAPAPALFDLDTPTAAGRGVPDTLEEALAEFDRQRAAVATAPAPARRRLLLAAESAGALIAAELHAAGLPWDVEVHERLLDDVLGTPPPGGGRPRGLDAAARRVRAALGDPTANLDSPPKLLRALHRVGIGVATTSRWELAEHEHPVIAPLLEYRQLLRLHTANGRAWIAEWVHDGRFRPVYVPAGVVTGRWASSGGGALQIPRQLRTAVRADPGWTFVIADVAQLEPRVLAAMAGDTALAAAARGRDLYVGVVERGAVATRDEAKVAMLGAMYGATTGESGRLVPRLRRAFPRAMALVDDAARAGEDGGRVSTWLGRSSPPPSAAWSAAQALASEAAATGGEETRARRGARDRGRFTRNFVVQGTAAEWALAWLAELRTRLATLPPAPEGEAAPRSGPVFARMPHLAFFLHDEIIVHTPRSYAERVADEVRASAASAARLLFGDFPIDFPLDLRIADSAAKG